MAGVAIMAFTLSMQMSIWRSRLANVPDISSFPYTMNDATMATRHTPASIVPAIQHHTHTRHMSTLDVLVSTVCSTAKRMNLNSNDTFMRSHSAMAPDSFRSASPVIENARTTPMPCTYSSTAPTMALCAAMRWPDNARALRCIALLISRNSAMVAITTAPSRQSKTSSMSAMSPENTNPEMTFEYTWPPAFCTSSSVLVIVPEMAPRLFSLK